MTETAISPIEHAVHTTNAWLKELMEELGWDDRQRAYRALRVVLQSLRDRLTTAEAADLGSQLPMLIRGLYYEGWRPAVAARPGHSREDFLAPIAAAFRDEDIYPEGVAWAVLRVLQDHVSAGEIADVKAILRKEVASLWPGEGVGHGS